MAYDETLAQRVRNVLAKRKATAERKMFGGLAFFLDDKMFCGILKNDLVLRLGPEGGAQALRSPHARPMDFTGRPMKGYIYIAPQGLQTDQALKEWLDQAIEFVSSIKKERTNRR